MKLCTFHVIDPAPESGPGRTTARLGAVSSSDPNVVIDLALAQAHLDNPSAGSSVHANGLGFSASADDARGPGPYDGPSDALHAPISQPWWSSMQAWLEGGSETAKATLELILRADGQEGPFRRPLETIQLLAPLPRPRSIRDCMAFREHFLQARRGGARMKYPTVARIDAYLRHMFGLALIGVPKRYDEMPVYYKGNPATVVGPEAEVRWPSYTERFDYELEVGLFIGRKGRDLSPEQALEHIAGYTIFNDFSARDAQLQEMELGLGPAKGKDFDAGNAMGPYLVTPEEVGDPSKLNATARVNGEVWTDSSTRGIQFSVGEIVSYISRSETLHPGDFIGLGTVPDGCGLEHGRWLKPGDVVELEVSRLGLLRNRVTR